MPTVSSEKLTTLKVCIHDAAGSSPVANEVSMLQRLGKFAQGLDHPGLDFTRVAEEIFEIPGHEDSYSIHYCMVFPPQGPSLRKLQELLPNARLPKLLVRSMIHRLFFSVNWLHATCGVIHTGRSFSRLGVPHT